MKNKNITIISIFALILIATAGYYFWLPEYYEYKELSQFLKQKKDMIKQEESYLNELNDQLGEISRRQEQFSVIESALPSDPSLPALFNFIQATAGENGLSLSSITASTASAASAASAASSPSTSQQPPINIGGLKPLLVKISTAGSYASLKNFIQAVYKNSRIIEVDNIVFSSPKKDDGLFDFNLQLQTNYF